MKAKTECKFQGSKFHKLSLSLYITFIAFFSSYIFSNELSESYQIVDSESGVITTQKNHTVFGQNLFNGNFAKDQFSGFNPYYRLTVGDKLLVQMWGAVEIDKESQRLAAKLNSRPVRSLFELVLPEVKAKIAGSYTNPSISFASSLLNTVADRVTLLSSVFVSNPSSQLLDSSGTRFGLPIKLV